MQLSSNKENFFFQAEDDIRDFHVTGVQTCALPISPQADNYASRRALEKAGFTLLEERQLDSDDPSDAGPSAIYTLARTFVNSAGLPVWRLTLKRSEERRVGKECRIRWWVFIILYSQ